MCHSSHQGFQSVAGSLTEWITTDGGLWRDFLVLFRSGGFSRAARTLRGSWVPPYAPRGGYPKRGAPDVEGGSGKEVWAGPNGGLPFLRERLGQPGERSGERGARYSAREQSLLEAGQHLL